MKLRPCEPEDLDLLYSIENNPELWSTSNSDMLYSRYALKQYIASAQSIHACGELRLVIEINESESTPRAIGLVDLTNYSPLNARAEIGIALLKEYRGKGYGQRAMKLMEQIAVNRLRIHSLYALVSPKNSASHNLFSKSNYKAIANLPDWHFLNGNYEEITLFSKIF